MIYKGEWNEQIVYFELNTINDCEYFYFFNEDGGRIVSNLPDLRATSINWTLVYEYGDYFTNSPCFNQEEEDFE